jgi:serine protease Do
MKGILILTAILLAAAIPALAQDPGWIGITIEDQKDGGAVVRSIETNSPAERAGLRQGDIVLEFNREAVIGAQQLTRLVRETPVGRTVDVKVRRDGRDQTLKLTTERGDPFHTGRIDFNLPDVKVLTDRIVRDMPRMQVHVSTITVQNGIRVEQMTDQLREFFGVSGTNGVLVTSVDSGSAADKAGLKAGDVITAVDARNIRTPAEFNRELRAGSRATVKVLRDKKEVEIRLE